MNDPRGSKWRKWDLHIHTPASLVIGYGNSANVWEDYITDSGGIENIAIRDEICNILEGGKDAFTKREQKYGFVNI